MDQIFCFTVCDPFVVAAWAENQVNVHFSNFSSIQSINLISILQNVDGKVRLLADTCGEFTKALDLELDLTEMLGSVRCKVF